LTSRNLFLRGIFTYYVPIPVLCKWESEEYAAQ
jgi:hypothetical protein